MIHIFQMFRMFLPRQSTTILSTRFFIIQRFIHSIKYHLNKNKFHFLLRNGLLIRFRTNWIKFQCLVLTIKLHPNLHRYSHSPLPLHKNILISILSFSKRLKYFFEIETYWFFNVDLKLISVYVVISDIFT